MFQDGTPTSKCISDGGFAALSTLGRVTTDLVSGEKFARTRLVAKVVGHMATTTRIVAG
jgi:hypothetical protein